jgi:predicted dehydrogenase
LNRNSCRWGILSTASIGHKNWQAIKLSGNGIVTAVASRQHDASQNYIDNCQARVAFAEPPRALGSYEALLEDENVDAVYIPLPTGLRKQWVIRAAEAGKHVLCEKPCAISAGELQEMISACADNGVQFMDGVMYMHSSRLNKMRQVLDDQTLIGKVKRIASQFSFNAPEEFKQGNIRTNSDLEPQGCLGDLGWYTIRFALWVMKYQLPTSVRGRILKDFQRSGSPHSVPMEFSAELFFEHGVSASFYNSFVTDHQQWANISGTAGLLHVFDFVLPYNNTRAAKPELEFFVSNSEFVIDGCDFAMNNHTRRLTVEEASNSAADSQETRLFRNFGEIVLSGRLDPVWPEIALKTQQVMDACLASARRGGELVEL